MDEKTAEIRYGQWLEIIRACNTSGQSKHAYCEQNGINEKRFYYYQHQIRKYIATQVEGAEESETTDNGKKAVPANRPENGLQIVKIGASSCGDAHSATVDFIANGVKLSVSEDVSPLFLGKLLEAVRHASR